MKTLLFSVILLLSCFNITAQTNIKSGEIWKDTDGKMINAHGGGVLYDNGTYYWFGEFKNDSTGNAMDGVSCYSSSDLTNWKNEGIALSVFPVNSFSDIEQGCILERPKVIYNKNTNKYVMWFHLELKGKGYLAARTGVAVSDNATGPYKFLYSYRPCPGIWPANMTEAEKKCLETESTMGDFAEEKAQKAIINGVFNRRDHIGGQMARDMTLFVDDDGKAYHIYSSEENYTINIAELSDDYLSHTGVYYRMEPGRQNEAPAIFKKDGVYYMFASGCTGWAPNKARLFSATSIKGPWTEHPNPCRGKDADITFYGQSTFVLPIANKPNTYIFMADIWNSKCLIDSRYIWLPIKFENNLPIVEWQDSWSL